MTSTDPTRSPDPNSPFDPFVPFDPWTRRPMPKRPFETTAFCEVAS
jgi:hypothetical protein